MNAPIQSGDVRLVIDGIFGAYSPNIGKQVTVHGLRGEHSKYGRIWLCAGKDLVTEYGAKGNSCEFAADWLQKLPEQVIEVQSEMRAVA